MFFDEEEHRNTKMLNFENLIAAIEKLDADGIISFENFKALSFSEIRKKYFVMPNHGLMLKAITRLSDMREGKEVSSVVTSVTKKFDAEGNETIITRTHTF
jgi:hypothetical protein